MNEMASSVAGFNETIAVFQCLFKASEVTVRNVERNPEINTLKTMRGTI